METTNVYLQHLFGRETERHLYTPKRVPIGWHTKAQKLKAEYQQIKKQRGWFSRPYEAELNVDSVSPDRFTLRYVGPDNLDRFVIYAEVYVNETNGHAVMKIKVLPIYRMLVWALSLSLATMGIIALISAELGWMIFLLSILMFFVPHGIFWNQILVGTFAFEQYLATHFKLKPHP